MASGKNNYWSARLLNMLNGAVGTIPTPLFLALYTVAPTVSTAGTEAPAAGNYGRVSITGNVANWPTITVPTTTMTSGAAFTFAVASADWAAAANMVAAALLDVVTQGAGNMFYFGSLTVSKPVFNGDTANFPTGSVTIQEL